MKARTYEIMRRAVEEGVAYGWRRAHKYNDKPDDASLKEAIEDGVMSEVCEWFEFTGNTEEETDA